jgi:hypothetical protein
VNAVKTVSMTSCPNFKWPAHRIGAYNRRLSGEPVDYLLRESVMEECEVCGRQMQHRCLKRHMDHQHQEVTNFTPPSLYVLAFTCAKSTTTFRCHMGQRRRDGRLPCASMRQSEPLPFHAPIHTRQTPAASSVSSSLSSLLRFWVPLLSIL